MFTLTKHLGLATAVALTILGIAATEAQAQIQMANGLQAAPATSAAVAGYYSSGSRTPASPLYPPGSGTTLPNPFPPYPYPPYPNPYYQPYDPVYNYMQGTSQLIDSYGRAQMTTQQTYLMQEQVKREKLENRRRAFDDWLYRRANTPTAVDEFERSQKLELRRSQNDPPVTEILSAKALNDLLIDVQKLQSREARGPDILLAPETLKKINVSPPGKGDANIGLLKSEGKLTWPQSLRGDAFKAEREQFEALISEAMPQAQQGAVKADLLNQMKATVDKMFQTLSGNIKEMAPSQYIEAKRFLTNCQDAVKALSREDVANYFNGKYAARGNTVAELVQNMTADGLRFAPATPGEESAYVALHRLLANYDVSLNAALAQR